MYKFSRSSEDEQHQLTLRPPLSEDGAAVFGLIQSCPPLDTNSMYCNLLQCHHFAQTSVLAESQGEIAGFVSGYRIPNTPSTLFIWQVAVGEQARGQGLAAAMIQHLLSRIGNEGITHIETTITETNGASWALFEGLARRMDVALDRSVLFDHQKHFSGSHDSEILVSIGPFHP